MRQQLLKKLHHLPKCFGAIIFMLTLTSTAFAQNVVIEGTVKSNEDNEALPGVSVLVKGTTNGITTGIDGKYKLTVPDKATLVFSFVGYEAQEVKVGNQSIVDVTLQLDNALLEEVVVVGYGSQKKSDITGAVSSIKAEELTAFPLENAEQALQGRAAGVVVQSNNGGEPGAPISIRIRGNTSISASSSPLIVVDGFVGAAMPQPADIESMEVLKDASATAIYGSRGSNGVVMVTTKKGKSGKTSVEVNSNYSVQNTANRLDLLNASEFAAYQQVANPNYVQGPANTDWQDLLYRAGSTQNHQASFSGGKDNVNFYASANYFKQDGVIINSQFEKFTFLSNIDAQVTNKLKLGFNVYGNRSEKDGVPTQSTGETANGGGDDVISLMFRFMPDLGVKDADGLNSINSIGDNIDNPFSVATESVNNTKTDDYRANLYANYDILKNLTFKTTLGFSSTNQTFGLFRPSTLIIQAGSGLGGRARISNFRRTNVLSENYLTYNKEIGKGNLSLLGGYSYQKSATERFAMGATGFTSDSFSFYNMGGSSVTEVPSSAFTEQEIQSQFGRANFDYDDKYLVTATVRRDGASNFAANNKYAIFPSGAIGWRLSNENFLKDNATISNLKLRASYGVTGNQAIGAYESLARFGTIFAGLNGQQINAVVPDQSANANLKWESSYQTNIGLDLGLLNNKITLALDYYNIDTKDLLLADQSQPEYLGFQTLASIRNVGEINNRGFEVTLNTRNINRPNFSWSTDFNWSTNRNTVVSLINGIDVFLDASPGYFSIARTHMLREGEAAGVFWGYDYRGVYQGADLPAGTATFQGAVAGDPLFTDLDGSGRITTADQQIIGDPNPDFTMGITNNFTYKNFDLNIFFQGAYGGDIFNLTRVQLLNGDSNALRDVLDSWTPTNTDSNIPRVVGNRGREISSRFVEDGSYTRLKNIALGYSVPSAVAEKLKMSGIRLSVSAQNLLTFTKYSGLDPEVSYFGAGGGNSASGNTTQGFDFGNFPTVRSVNFSLNLKF